MGSIYDRPHEHLGTTDLAVIRLRRMLVNAARQLEQGIDPRGIEADGPFAEIRSAERIIDADDDWRLLGTSADPHVPRAADKMAAQ